MDNQDKVAKIEVIDETENVPGNVVRKKIGDKHLYAMEHIASNIDIGYDNFEIEKLCRWIYLPTPMIPPKVLSQEILWWMIMDNYEATIDSQMEDAQEMQIEKCAYRNCGFLFVDIQFHYWQYHPQHIRPNMNQAGMIDKKDTEDKLQEVQEPYEKSDQVEDRDSVKHWTIKHQNKIT